MDLKGEYFGKKNCRQVNVIKNKTCGLYAMNESIKLEINIDSRTGNPAIFFTHFEKRGYLIDWLVGEFVKQAKEHGIQLVSPGGHLETGKPELTCENYMIVIKKEEKRYE